MRIVVWFVFERRHLLDHEHEERSNSDQIWKNAVGVWLHGQKIIRVILATKLYMYFYIRVIHFVAVQTWYFLLYQNCLSSQLKICKRELLRVGAIFVNIFSYGIFTLGGYTFEYIISFMKNTLSLIVILLTLVWVYAESTESLEAAERLAADYIIVQKSSGSGYRLDDFVLRQEVIWTAIKLAGVTLPDNYSCQWYYRDVTSSSPNTWACRALELAADEWIITRANENARPEDRITRAEALAIILATKELSAWPWNLRVDSSANDWQTSLLQKAVQNGILVFGTNFWPNIPATRGEVFVWADRLRNGTAPEDWASLYSWTVSSGAVSGQDQLILQSMFWVGPRDAEYTIFEFSNLGCPYCKRLFDADTLSWIAQAAPGSVRTVVGVIDGYHSDRSQSMTCAWVIGGGDAYMKAEKYFFKNFNGWGLSWFARHMGMDQALIDTCIEDEGYLDNYQMTYHIIHSYGITWTPSVMLINNQTWAYQVLGGARKLSEYVGVIEEL